MKLNFGFIYIKCGYIGKPLLTTKVKKEYDIQLFHTLEKAQKADVEAKTQFKERFLISMAIFHNSYSARLA